MKQEEKRANLLVIDDDPVFRNMLIMEGGRRGYKIVACGSLKELQNMPHPRNFDVAVIDYFLDGIQEQLNGVDVALALEGTRIVLTSGSSFGVETNQAWPQSIRRFVLKSKGPRAIIDAASSLA